MPKYTQEKKNECQIIFKLLTNNNENKRYDKESIAELFRVNGAAIDDKELNEVYERLSKKFTFEDFQREFVEIYQRQWDADNIINELKKLDNNYIGLIKKDDLIDLMKNYENPLNNDDIKTILELAHPDEKGNIDYEDFVKKLMS